LINTAHASQLPVLNSKEKSGSSAEFYHCKTQKKHRCLIEDLESRAHGGLNVQDLDVLPVLLEQRDQKVNGELNVEGNITGSHGDIGNCKRHAHNLLHLELDSGLGDVNLLTKIVGLIEDGRELTSLSKTRTQDTRDLLDQRSRGKEVIILLGELLNELLVLVELLEIIHGHLVNAELVSFFAMFLVTKNTDAGVGARNNRELESSGETLISGRIVVLQSNLKFDGLGELAHLSLELSTLLVGDSLTTGEGENVGDGRIQKIAVELAHC
jgi:hypothetical protein